MQLIDPNHPTYRPLWVRLAIVGSCFGWAIVELVAAQPFWAILAGAAGAYAAYMLLLTFNPQDPPAATGTVADDPEDDEETPVEKKQD
ncbi:hypothetical protein LJR030_005374 [Rhizobium sp. LjRoot30]|uniref:hypothetical protein n=1 Tax=Rhizobium sp. LjRoot30 TaxID=3342320 RepID=UPI003ECD03D5